MNPKNLSEQDFQEINDVSREMWANPKSLGEFVQCKSCHTMSSKEDVFGKFPDEIKNNTISRIMNLLGWWEHDVLCPKCGWGTEMIYGSINIRKIQRRLLESTQAFLVLCRNTEGEIVGYEEAYVDSLDAIFEGEFAYHYRDVWVREIARRVHERIGHSPRELLVLSSIGFIPEYQSASTLFRLLAQFARILPEDRMDDLPGITEIDRNNGMHKISSRCGAVSLWISDDPIERWKVKNTGPNYKSDLIVYKDPIRQYKTQFDSWGRGFLRKQA